MNVKRPQNSVLFLVQKQFVRVIVIWFHLVDFSWRLMYDFLESVDQNARMIIVMWKYRICRLEQHRLFGGFSFIMNHFTISSVWSFYGLVLDSWLNIIVFVLLCPVYTMIFTCSLKVNTWIRRVVINILNNDKVRTVSSLYYINKDISNG